MALRFPPLILLLTLWFDILQYLFLVFERVIGVFVTVFSQLLSLATTVIPAALLSIPGLLGFAGLAIDAMAVALVISNFVFSIIQRRITPLELYKPLTQIATAGSGIYSKIFLIVILTGLFSGPLLQLAFPFIQRAVNEINCYVVMYVHDVVQLIGAPIADIYNAVVPDINTVLSFIYAFAKPIFEGILDRTVLFVKILLLILEDPKSIACFGTHPDCTDFQNSSDFTCPTEQLKCLYINSLQFYVNDVIGGLLNSIPFIGTVVSKIIVGKIWLGIDWFYFLPTVLGGILNQSGCTEQPSCITCSLQYAGPVALPCCIAARYACLLEETFLTDKVRVPALILQFLTTLPIIGPILNFILNIFKTIADFINTNVIDPLNSVLNFLLAGLTAPLNAIATVICDILVFLLLRKKSAKPFCNLGFTPPHDIIPQIPDTIASVLNFATQPLRRLLSLDTTTQDPDAIAAAAAQAACLAYRRRLPLLHACRPVYDEWCQDKLGSWEPFTNTLQDVPLRPKITTDLDPASDFTAVYCLFELIIHPDQHETATAGMAQWKPHPSSSSLARQQSYTTEYNGELYGAVDAMDTNSPLLNHRPMRVPATSVSFIKTTTGLGTFMASQVRPSKDEICTVVEETVFTASRSSQVAVFTDYEIPELTYARSRGRELLAVGCAADGTCSLDAAGNLVFMVTNPILRSIVNVVLMLATDFLTLFMDIFGGTSLTSTNGLSTTSPFSSLTNTNVNLSDLFIRIDTTIDNAVVRELTVIERGLILLEDIINVLADLRIDSLTGLVGFVYQRFLQCSSPDSYDARTNPTGTWRLFCLLHLQLPFPFPGLPTLADAIVWDQLPCLTGLTCVGFSSTFVDPDGTCLPCTCALNGYPSCKTIYPSGGHLLSALISGTFEWLSSIAAGFAAVAGGDLRYGMPQLLAQTVTLPFNIPFLAGGSRTFVLVRAFPLLDMFLRLGLDANLHSLARSSFPGGAPGPPQDLTFTVTIPGPCVFVMLPETGKYIPIVIAWVFVVLIVFVVSVIFLVQLAVALLIGLLGLPFVIIGSILRGLMTIVTQTPSVRVVVVQQTITQNGFPETGLITGAGPLAPVGMQSGSIRSLHDPVGAFAEMFNGQSAGAIPVDRPISFTDPLRRSAATPGSYGLMELGEHPSIESALARFEKRGACVDANLVERTDMPTSDRWSSHNLYDRSGLQCERVTHYESSPYLFVGSGNGMNDWTVLISSGCLGSSLRYRHAV